MSSITQLAIASIRIDGGTQSRVALNEDAVADYAATIREGTDFPPVIVFHDGAAHWLADGFHRFHAYRAAGAEEIPADIRPGTCRDAVLYSVGANASHGLRRSNADKRRCVETLLKDAEWAKWSDREIAKACGVSHEFVRQARAICQPLTDEPETRTVTRKGKTYQQNTAKIGGKSKPAPEPTPEPESTPTPTDEPEATPEPEAQPTPEPAPAKTKPAKGLPDLDELARLREENAALHAQVANLQDQLSEMVSACQTMSDDLASYGRVIEADDQAVAAQAEAKRFRELNRALEERLHGLMNEKNEYIRLTKSWKAKAEKLQKKLDELNTARF